MKKIIQSSLLLISLLVFSPQILKAQYFDDLNVGVKIGGALPSLSNTFEMIYPPIYQNYTWEEKGLFGFNGGVFLNWKPAESKLALQPEIYYSQEHFEDKYTDINGLKYTLLFKLNYIQLNTLFKYYPISGLNIGIGPQVGFILGSNPINYESNGEYQDPDTTREDMDAIIQREMNEGFKMKNNFQLVMNLGYEFENGIAIDARYNLGLSDMIETYSKTGTGWSEQDNKLSTIQFQLSYAFGLTN